VLKVLLRRSFFLGVALGAALPSFLFSATAAQALWNGRKLSSSFTVLLKISGQKQLDCSGVMIGPRLVLTAGHCLSGASRVSARIGSETIDIENWLVNPSWSAGLPADGWDARISAQNGDRYIDLAVLLLAHAPSHAQSLELTASATPQGSLTTYGYARDAMLSPLYKIDASNASLLSRLSPRGPFKLYASGGSAWCQGDSGGPVTRFENGSEKLVGIVGLGLGAIEHEPSSALSMRWGGPERIPKCGAYSYVQDVHMHADWIAQASASLSGDVPFTASTNKRHAQADTIFSDEDLASGAYRDKL
jgi:secreted trypsin-like serine protease